MYKWLLTIFMVITWITADYSLNEHKEHINQLEAQVQQLNAELTAIKHQQLLNNAVTEDLSNRVGWR